MFYRDVKQNKSNKSTLPEINYLKTCFCSAGRKIFFHGPHAINKKKRARGLQVYPSRAAFGPQFANPWLKITFLQLYS